MKDYAHPKISLWAVGNKYLNIKGYKSYKTDDSRKIPDGTAYEIFTNFLGNNLSIGSGKNGESVTLSLSDQKILYNFLANQLPLSYFEKWGKDYRISFTRKDYVLHALIQDGKKVLNFNGSFYQIGKEGKDMDIMMFILRNMKEYYQMKYKIIITITEIREIIKDSIVGIRQEQVNTQQNSRIEEPLEESDTNIPEANGVALEAREYKPDGSIDCCAKGCSFSCQEKIINFCTSDIGKKIYKGYVFCPNHQKEVKDFGINIT